MAISDPQHYPIETLSWDDWRQQLAQETKAAHRRLDHHPTLAALVKADLSREAYTKALLVFAQIWTDFGRQFSWAAPIAKSANADLRYWNHPSPVRTNTLPKLNGPAADAWQYVMWGSSRGGKFLLRSVAESIPDAPHYFLNSLTQLRQAPFTINHAATTCVPYALACFEHWFNTCEIYQ